MHSIGGSGHSLSLLCHKPSSQRAGHPLAFPSLAPFGSDSSSACQDNATEQIALVMPSDGKLVDPFVIALLSQVQVI